MGITWTLVWQGSLVIAALIGAWQWIAWILGKGRFRAPKPKGLLQDFAATIAGDFRHILASALFVLFALALLLPGDTGHGLPPAAQYALNSFPGLLGAVIGFYFGKGQPQEAIGRFGIDADPVDLQPSRELANPLAPDRRSSDSDQQPSDSVPAPSDVPGGRPPGYGKDVRRSSE